MVRTSRSREERSVFVDSRKRRTVVVVYWLVVSLARDELS
jgi:hypothetical protein